MSQIENEFELLGRLVAEGKVPSEVALIIVGLAASNFTLNLMKQFEKRERGCLKSLGKCSNDSLSNANLLGS